VVLVVAVIRWTPSVPGILLAVASATALVAAVGW
jgi:sulfate permease, SulP family